MNIINQPKVGITMNIMNQPKVGISMNIMNQPGTRISTIIMKNKGMSMIEVVVATALMGIIAISMLAMFSNGYSFIVKAGDKSKAIRTAQAQVEVAMSEKNALASPANLVILFHDGTTIMAPGEKVTKTGLFNHSTVAFEVFQPTN